MRQIPNRLSMGQSKCPKWRSSCNNFLWSSTKSWWWWWLAFERPSSSSSIVISPLRTDGMVAHFSDYTKYWPQFPKVWFNLGYPVDKKQYFRSCSDLDIFLLKYSSPPRQRQRISLTRKYYHLRLKKYWE